MFIIDARLAYNNQIVCLKISLAKLHLWSKMLFLAQNATFVFYGNLDILTVIFIHLYDVYVK